MREIINFNRKWTFTKMADAVPETMPEKWDIVNLPHSWNAIDGQDGDNDFYRGTCYYAKSFMKGSLPEADRYYLEIRGANSSADVYVNGKHLAHHDGRIYNASSHYINGWRDGHEIYKRTASCIKRAVKSDS